MKRLEAPKLVSPPAWQAEAAARLCLGRGRTPSRFLWGAAARALRAAPACLRRFPPAQWGSAASCAGCCPRGSRGGSAVPRKRGPACSCMKRFGKKHNARFRLTSNLKAAFLHIKVRFFFFSSSDIAGFPSQFPVETV